MLEQNIIVQRKIKSRYKTNAKANFFLDQEIKSYTHLETQALREG